MTLSIDDVSPENFFKRITFQSDATPGTKLVIPDGDFVMAAVNLLLAVNIKNLSQEIRRLK